MFWFLLALGCAVAVYWLDTRELNRELYSEIEYIPTDVAKMSMLNKFDKRMAFLKDVIAEQEAIGNDDTALHFQLVYHEAERILSDIKIMISEDPDITEQEVKAYLTRLVRG